MTKKMTMKATNPEDLSHELKQISLDNPNKIVTAWAKFGKATAFIRDKQPGTDSPDTIQTFEEDGGFWKNGQVITPTKAWFNRHNFIPCGDR